MVSGDVKDSGYLLDSTNSSVSDIYKKVIMYRLCLILLIFHTRLSELELQINIMCLEELLLQWQGSL